MLGTRETPRGLEKRNSTGNGFAAQRSTWNQILPRVCVPRGTSLPDAEAPKDLTEKLVRTYQPQDLAKAVLGKAKLLGLYFKC